MLVTSTQQSTKARWQTDFRLGIRISCFSGNASARASLSSPAGSQGLSSSKVSAAAPQTDHHSETSVRAPPRFGGPLGLSHHLEIPRDTRPTALGTLSTLLPAATTRPLCAFPPLTLCHHSGPAYSSSTTQGDQATPNTTHIRPRGDTTPQP